MALSLFRPFGTGREQPRHCPAEGAVSRPIWNKARNKILKIRKAKRSNAALAVKLSRAPGAAPLPMSPCHLPEEPSPGSLGQQKGPQEPSAGGALCCPLCPEPPDPETSVLGRVHLPVHRWTLICLLLSPTITLMLVSLNFGEGGVCPRWFHHFFCTLPWHTGVCARPWTFTTQAQAGA